MSLLEDSEQGKECKTAMLRARLTWVESRFFESIVLSRVDAPSAVTGIDEVVRTFESANIEPNMIQGYLWKTCQRVAKGEAA